MKNVVFFIANQITQTQRHTLWSLGIGPNLPFSTGKVFAEILNFSTGDLYVSSHTGPQKTAKEISFHVTTNDMMVAEQF